MKRQDRGQGTLRYFLGEETDQHAKFSLSRSTSICGDVTDGRRFVWCVPSVSATCAALGPSGDLWESCRAFCGVGWWCQADLFFLEVLGAYIYFKYSLHQITHIFIVGKSQTTNKPSQQIAASTQRDDHSNILESNLPVFHSFSPSPPESPLSLDITV